MIIESPSDKFPGTVTIPDGFGWPETVAFYGMMRDIANTQPEEAFYKMLPGLIKLVIAWDIVGFPAKPEKPEDIPVKPFPEVIKVLGAIFGALQRVNASELDVPLAS